MIRKMLVATLDGPNSGPEMLISTHGKVPRRWEAHIYVCYEVLKRWGAQLYVCYEVLSPADAYSYI